MIKKNLKVKRLIKNLRYLNLQALDFFYFYLAQNFVLQNCNIYFLNFYMAIFVGTHLSSKISKNYP